MKTLIQGITICDVDPTEEYDHCPNCGSTEGVIEESSGPLTQWTQCLSCGVWFNPEVQFTED